MMSCENAWLFFIFLVVIFLIVILVGFLSLRMMSNKKNKKNTLEQTKASLGSNHSKDADSINNELNLCISNIKKIESKDMMIDAIIIFLENSYMNHLAYEKVIDAFDFVGQISFIKKFHKPAFLKVLIESKRITLDSLLFLFNLEDRKDDYDIPRNSWGCYRECCYFYGPNDSTSGKLNMRDILSYIFYDGDFGIKDFCKFLESRDKFKRSSQVKKIINEWFERRQEEIPRAVSALSFGERAKILGGDNQRIETLKVWILFDSKTHFDLILKNIELAEKYNICRTRIRNNNISLKAFNALLEMGKYNHVVYAIENNPGILENSHLDLLIERGRWEEIKKIVNTQGVKISEDMKAKISSKTVITIFT